MKSNLHFYFFALAARGEGLSGSDRIFIEFARRWSEKNLVEIFLWEEGLKMSRRQGLQSSKVKFNVFYLSKWQKIGFFISYAVLIIKSIWLALKLDLRNQGSVILYSASDFWMDSLPCYILKSRYPKALWIGSWYLTAPNPLKGFKEGESSLRMPKLNEVLYWLSQKLILYLIRKKADIVLVTSEPDKSKFPALLVKERVTAVKGGVDFAAVKIWRKKFKDLPKVYDAVFQGRFHPQKGVLELIDIWNLVAQKKKNAKLIVIGDGPLFNEIEAKIRKFNLENNIILPGFIYDGEEKFKIFYQSKIVVHPAAYDSGGMAAAEAMAWGLPGVSFDLQALRTYYPKGMLKAPLGNARRFAQLVIKLLNDSKFYQERSAEAKSMIEQGWDWNKRADTILTNIKRNF